MTLPSLITKRKETSGEEQREKKRYESERKSLDLDVLDEISEKLDNLAKVCRSNSSSMSRYQKG